NGHVKVLDFGLAKLMDRSTEGDQADTEAVTRAFVQTDAGVVMGTSLYMSPEQARGKGVDARSDIWSLGVILYEMAAGRAPFMGETKTDVIVAIAKSEPSPLARFAPGLPPEFEWVVMKALRKSADERYQTIKELESDLKKLKQKVVFQTELERSMGPDRLTGAITPFGDTEVPHHSSHLSFQASLPATMHSTSTVQSAAQTRASSVEYILEGIKRHKLRAAMVAFAALLLAGGIWYLGFRKPTMALTDKDRILLADFVNTTDDTVFDVTLKQALATQLRQSPFLDILSEDRVRDALKFMEKSPDEPVTRDIALEICRRQGIEATLIGTISSIGSRYVITLDALNAETGDTIASDQAEAENKEQVLRSLGEAATRLREKLGEKLSSIQKYDVPIEQVTTSKLEALRYYSVGFQQHSSGRYTAAIPLYQHAIEVDQKFAIAYARLASCYNNTKQYEAARAASSKAYEYRDRASEREKLYVEWNYYGAVTGEIDRAADALDVWKRTFPRDWEPHHLLAVRHTLTGPFQSGVDEASEAVRLNAREPKAHANLANAFIGLNRFDEGKKILQNALGQNMETESMHTHLFRLAFVNGDATGMNEQVVWATKNSGFLANVYQAEAAEFYGKYAEANQFSDKAVDWAEHNNKDAAAQLISKRAMRAATFRDCGKITAVTAKALSYSRDLSNLEHSANALAACGQAAAAQSLVDEMQKRFPQDTLLNIVWIPLIRAQFELARGNGAPAVQLLESARKYDVYGDFWPQYVRAQAYAKQGNGAQAATEFKNILDHRGWYPLSPVYALAQLGYARASAQSGDNATARKAYQDFFDLWKNADATVPFVAEARQEYDKLK
ncbi:MAG TPA: tetratricopeptide repeat protein, partial [Pyrinomonadaceae bacterium]